MPLLFVWCIQTLETIERTLNFSSAGLGECHTAALVADGATIVNALTLLEMQPDGCVQVIVCESCGIVHCESGGWVQPRRLRDAVVWLPCLDRLHDDRNEYAPPEFLTSRGLPFFDRQRAQRLAELVPLFAPAEIPPVSRRDAALLTQWFAPRRILGEPGTELSVQRDRIVSTSVGDLDDVLAKLENPPA